MSVESAFERLLGRQVSAEQRERLQRLRDALHLGDNDALWLIVIALEHYDALFRQYPERLEAVTQATLERVRGACASAAAQQAARAQRVLSDRVVEASRQMAKTLAERPFPWTAAPLAMAAVVAFGALCVAAGCALSSPARPYWAAAAAQGPVAIVLGVPAGWMILALAFPALLHVGRLGWKAAYDPDARFGRAAGGWALAALSALTAAACALALAKIL